MRFTLLRIICTTQFWCFFTAQNVQKIKRPAVLFYMHICMYVRVFVTECTITTAKQSVCLNCIKQSRDRDSDSDKNYITSGSPNFYGEEHKYATLIVHINNARIGYIKMYSVYSERQTDCVKARLQKLHIDICRLTT